MLPRARQPKDAVFHRMGMSRCEAIDKITDSIFDDVLNSIVDEVEDFISDYAEDFVETI